MSNTCSLETLSTEVLLKIFKYLDVYDLCKLKQTCKRFNEIIETWAHWFISSVRLLVTNQIHPVILQRSARILSPFERFRISRNWKIGIYSEQSILSTRTKYIPWLQLEQNLLWMSRGNKIRAYKRTSKGINNNVMHTLEGTNAGEISRFALKDGLILAGQTDGGMWLWSKDNSRFIFNMTRCHKADINSVDMSRSLMVSGSRDNHVKIWRKPSEVIVDSSEYFCLLDRRIHDRVWSVNLCEDDESLLAIGTSGTSNTKSLVIFNIANQNSNLRLGSGRIGAGILDIQWENPYILWTCGYDSYLRRWDLRSGRCEQSFADPCETTIYCFQYDHCNTIISGTQCNGRAVLWDTRQKNYVQMYFMECCKLGHKSSPVYGLSFDAEFLFTATDQHLSILDYSVSKGKFRDYSNLFLKLIKV